MYSSYKYAFLVEERRNYSSNSFSETYAENRGFETDSFPPNGYSWVQHQPEQTNHLCLQLWTQLQKLSASAATDSRNPTYAMPFWTDHLILERNPPLEKSKNGDFFLLCQILDEGKGMTWMEWFGEVFVGADSKKKLAGRLW